jgi:putative lipoic acid-binding regulatory protein
MTDGSKPLLEFPCDLPVKVFGRNEARFRTAVLAILESHFGAAVKVAEQPSKRANYVSLTVTVRAESRAQADAAYAALVANEHVLMAL